METTEEILKLSIKEACAEIRHVQSQMNAIVVRSIEDTFAGDTEIEHLQHDMMLALRHYQDALFATIKLLRLKCDHHSMSLWDKLNSMNKTCPETPNNEIRPIR